MYIQLYVYGCSQIRWQEQGMIIVFVKRNIHILDKSIAIVVIAEGTIRVGSNGL